jgi:hypothetical protein
MRVPDQLLVISYRYGKIKKAHFPLPLLVHPPEVRAQLQVYPAILAGSVADKTLIT